MKVWEEAEVLVELVTARTVAAIADSEKEIKKLNTKKHDVVHNRISFLLVLARKYQRKQYEFVYYPSETYERIEEVFAATAVVLDHGTSTGTETGSDITMDDEDNDRMVWTGQSSSSSSDEEDDERRAPCFESYYVGKAIFHTVSGEPLMRIEGSPGWREALKQKYYSLDSKSRVTVNKVVGDKKGHTGGRSNVAVKAVAAAAVGGGVATGGTAMAAGAMGYTASGIVANSAAAAIMSAEAVAGGGGVVAGGFTATMQTIGAVGVMASPVGMTLAAGGAVVGLAGYYWMNRRHRRKQEEQEQKAKELLLMEALNRLENAGEEPVTKPVNQYLQVPDDDTDHQGDENLWVMVAAKRIAMEETEHSFDHSSWEEQVEAEKSFQEVSRSTAAKALFDPQGVLVQLDADPADKDGWEMALRLHYDFMVEHDIMIPTTHKKHGEGATEDTPLLTVED